MKRFLLALICSIVFVFSTISQEIIPQPIVQKKVPGVFKFDTNINVFVNSAGAASASKIFVDKFKSATGKSLQIEFKKNEGKKYISVILSDTAIWCGDEGYHLNVNSDEIVIVAQKEAGAFYAFETLRQIMPTDFEKNNGVKINDIFIPNLKISDKPKFGWRAMNFDCCRHFMDVNFVKRYIDLLASHKMNILHWHLTEDQGWRIEIKKYPLLTEIGAWRVEDDGTIYGGFYTQEDIKDVVDYAAKRYINVIPEIEMPGHSVAALAAYPYLSCIGGPFHVEKRWGVFNDIYCAGNDSVFLFLQDVLTEVMTLFPSKHIHIGGDEAPKVRWQNCQKCQNRIKMEGLKSEDELQSYFIKRMEKFLESKGRKIIGWDEILEGGLAPAATVQSWRGIEGGLEAASSGHDAIMSPVSHCYFDYRISTTNMEQVYSFDPIPDDLPKDFHHHILGGECCMWTETATQNDIDSRMFPRMCAISEVLWSYPKERNYSAFQRKMKTHYKRLDNLGVTYGYERDPIKLTMSYNKSKDVFVANVEYGQPGLKMFYTIDGSLPTSKSSMYLNPVEMKNSTTFKVSALREGAGSVSVEEREVVRNLAFLKKYSLTNKYSKKYVAGGDTNLTDGLRGTLSFHDNLWQGYEGIDFETILDLGEKTSINKVGVGVLQASLAWIFFPLKMEVYCSNDTKRWTKIGEVANAVPQTDAATSKQDLCISFKKKKTRYIKIVCPAMHECPDWHPGAGGKTWLFLDEIMVE